MGTCIEYLNAYTLPGSKSRGDIYNANRIGCCGRNDTAENHELLYADGSGSEGSRRESGRRRPALAGEPNRGLTDRALQGARLSHEGRPTTGAEAVAID